jgi:hypothetical protein
MMGGGGGMLSRKGRVGVTVCVSVCVTAWALDLSCVPMNFLTVRMGMVGVTLS